MDLLKNFERKSSLDKYTHERIRIRCNAFEYTRYGIQSELAAENQI